MLATLIDVAQDLSRAIPQREVISRLLAAMRTLFPADAVTLLRLSPGPGQILVAEAGDGLSSRVLGRAFPLAQHPRLAAICAGPGPIRFAADDPRPDPFDSAVAFASGHKVHACMGCALRVADGLVGALTLDAVAPSAFDAVDDQVVSLFAALAAAAMRLEGQFDALQGDLARAQAVVAASADEALARTGGELVGESLPMQHLRREIHSVAASNETVLILGETGTGKELVARLIQSLSPRARQPFVYLNCAALPEGLAESEFFGHTRGAFTGATAARAGKFELASGGTLFLDEVGELPLGLQPKLLRALQEGELQRVGADRPVTVDVRVIAATNRDLEAEVAAGRFRADLFHRLAVYPLRIPPLRVRGDDLELLTATLMERARARLGLRNLTLHDRGACALSAYNWPGNVRELEHVLLRAALRARIEDPAHPVIRSEHLDLPGCARDAFEGPRGPASPTPSLHDATDAFQRDLIRDAVEAAGGNWAGAARRLGVDRSNLHRLAGRLGLREGA